MEEGVRERMEEGGRKWMTDECQVRGDRREGGREGLGREEGREDPL